MKYYSKQAAILMLQDGTIFNGSSIAMKGTHGGEICFVAGMTGYQEIYTDPNYYWQVIVNTNAHIGYYGVLELEQESTKPTIQNHGFAVDVESLKSCDKVEVSHLNLNDNTIEGFWVKDKKAFSVQYHPESSSGPHNSRYLFDQFINLMKSN